VRHSRWQSSIPTIRRCLKRRNPSTSSVPNGSVFARSSTPAFWTNTMTSAARAPSLARLSTFDDDDNVVAIIETRRDTRTKLVFEESSEAFVVKKVLPQGMSFPFDYGFIPSTLADDGDPLDVLVLMDEPVPTGTIVPARLIGVIEAFQTEKDGASDTNDRLIAVAASCELFREVKKLGDAGVLDGGRSSSSCGTTDAPSTRRVSVSTEAATAASSRASHSDPTLTRSARGASDHGAHSTHGPRWNLRRAERAARSRARSSGRYRSSAHAATLRAACDDGDPRDESRE
jgi:inorganic pyrophosphatase